MGVIPLEECIVNTEHKVKKSHSFELISTKIQKTFYIQAQSEKEMSDWIEAVISGKNFYNVSAPYELNHEIHVNFTSETGFVVCFFFFVKSFILFNLNDFNRVFHLNGKL